MKFRIKCILILRELKHYYGSVIREINHITIKPQVITDNSVDINNWYGSVIHATGKLSIGSDT